MLADKDVAANVAVRDLKRAREFYEGTLGFEAADMEGERLVAYRSGHSMFFVYESQYAGSNKATTLTWSVGAQIETVVAALKAKGVQFEHYDLPGTTREGDIHVAGAMKAAWFKNPDGNILNIATGRR
jgi:catechol 2,3-dioxygenase-like lactoylglutathione lyase family enzyme